MSDPKGQEEQPDTDAEDQSDQDCPAVADIWRSRTESLPDED